MSSQSQHASPYTAEAATSVPRAAVSPHGHGELVSTLKYPRLDRAIYTILVGLFVLIFLGMVVGGVAACVNGEYGLGLALITIGLAGAAACVLGLAQLTRVIHFYEFAVESRTVGQKPRIIEYADLTEMTYNLTRQFVNGIYAGTAVRLVLRTRDKRSLRYSGSYKEKRRWWQFTMLSSGGDFAGDARFDSIRVLLASHLSASLLDAIAAGNSLPLGKALTVSVDGITPHRGKYKNKLVGFGEIPSVFFKEGALHFARQGDKKSFVAVPTGERNFWPMMIVLQTLHQVQIEQQQEGDTATDGQADPTDADAQDL